MLMKEFTRQFLQHTAPSRRHLTPELMLRLVTPACPLWAARAEDFPFPDPFWGFYWPGGQATARYILDNMEMIRDRRVLDVGCGCGAGAIAAAMRNAQRVIANDIDPYAVMAAKINAEFNKIKVETDTNNFVGSSCNDFDVILIGDMFYDEEFASLLFEWLHKLTADNKLVLIGDPGRHGLTASRRSQMTLLANYELPKETRDENNGFTHTTVWRLNKL
ncbi:electron transfer flavoprotein beta subunit lysine methyltransferase-like isoform X1 [Maniola hyperantus]|uniref:electron transfer flavoprotein beta subunit lysine methyltransferase-like isoform X1 n=1 Tax=Aphantopus hyperantus TaxID=2795564 RepID=UPI00156870D6|nr:electron transfer flavoprotein beta subunit lysine methyltransferase-like [Maniola hyperantus]